MGNFFSSLFGPKNLTTTTTPGTSGYVSGIMSQGAQAASQPFNPATVAGVAGFNPDQMNAFQSIRGGIADPYLNQAEQFARTGGSPITGSAIQNYMNPYQSSVIDATMQGIQHNNAIQQQQVKGNAASMGALGGSGQRVAQAELARNQDFTTNATLAGLNASNYGQALGAAQQDAQRAGQAAGTFGTLGQLAYLDPSSLLQSGNQQQQQAQMQLNYPAALAQAQQNYQFMTPAYQAQLASQMTPASGSTSTQPGPSPFSQIAGLGMTGLGLAGATGGFGPTGWLTGNNGLFSGWGRSHGGRVTHRANGGGIGAQSGGDLMSRLRSTFTAMHGMHKQATGGKVIDTEQDDEGTYQPMGFDIGGQVDYGPGSSIPGFMTGAPQASFGDDDTNQIRDIGVPPSAVLPGPVPQDDLRARLGAINQSYKPDPWLSVMQAGLGTMAAKSPWGLSNVGEGGQKGLEHYAGQQQLDLKNRAAQMQAETLLEHARHNAAAEAIAAGQREDWAAIPSLPGARMHKHTGELRFPGSDDTGQGGANSAIKLLSDIEEAKHSASERGKKSADREAAVAVEAEEAKQLKARIEHIRGLIAPPRAQGESDEEYANRSNATAQSLFGQLQGQPLAVAMRSVLASRGLSEPDIVRRQQQLDAAFNELAAFYAKSVFPTRVTNTDLSVAMQSKPRLTLHDWQTATGMLDKMNTQADVMLMRNDIARKQGIKALEDPRFDANALVKQLGQPLGVARNGPGPATPAAGTAPKALNQRLGEPAAAPAAQQPAGSRRTVNGVVYEKGPDGQWHDISNAEPYANWKKGELYQKFLRGETP